MNLLSASRRFASAIFGITILASATVTSLLALPQVLHTHETNYGRLSLYSDRSFDPAAGQAMLEDVQRRLSSAPPELLETETNWRIVISNSEWRGRLTFLDKYGAGGVNYHFLPEIAFLRQADLDRNRLIGNSGMVVGGERTLSYFAAHEIAHGMVTQRIGALARWRLPVWIDEGLADYVAFGGDVNIEKLTLLLREGHGDLDPATSGLYSRYLLLVAYFLQIENWSVDDLLSSAMAQQEAEHRLLSNIR